MYSMLCIIIEKSIPCADLSCSSPTVYSNSLLYSVELFRKR